MPKIYNTPGSEGDRPDKTGTSRQMMIVVAVIVALLIIFLLYRFARGIEYQPVAQPEQTAVSAIMVGGEVDRTETG
jgi:hypothetical protein